MALKINKRVIADLKILVWPHKDDRRLLWIVLWKVDLKGKRITEGEVEGHPSVQVQQPILVARGRHCTRRLLRQGRERDEAEGRRGRTVRVKGGSEVGVNLEDLVDLCDHPLPAALLKVLRACVSAREEREGKARGGLTIRAISVPREDMTM